VFPLPKFRSGLVIKWNVYVLLSKWSSALCIVLIKPSDGSTEKVNKLNFEEKIERNSNIVNSSLLQKHSVFRKKMWGCRCLPRLMLQNRCMKCIYLFSGALYNIWDFKKCSVPSYDRKLSHSLQPSWRHFKNKTFICCGAEGGSLMSFYKKGSCLQFARQV
jgi:hypothetical protein